MTFIVQDTRRETERECASRSEAKETKNDMVALGASPEDIEIIPPSKSDGGTVEAEPIDTEDNERVTGSAYENLPDEQPGVDTDPLDWVPSDFVDTIEGQPAINRKGYDVLAHHYEISVTTEVLVSPSGTGFEYAEVVATAETKEGVEYAAHGSAHIERGDDSTLLLEMADTRAAKRATARATGVGMVAVQELQNDL